MKKITFGVLIGLGLAPAASAQTTGASFLEIPGSPRAYALGLSNSVSALGAQAIDGANPANVGLMSRRFDAFSSYATLMEGAQYERLAGAYSPSRPIFGVDALGLSATRVQIGGLESSDSSGNKSGGTFGAADTSIAVSGAGRLSPNLRLGATAKAITASIGSYKSGTALAADLGLTYTLALSRPISIGGSLTNFGTGMKFLDQTDALPMGVNLGAAVPVGPALLVAEVNRLVNQRKTELGMGVEYGLGPVSFRAGFLARNNGGNLALADQNGAARYLNGLSGGVGVQLGIARLDYAVSQQAVEFGATQRLALSLQWGGASEHAASSPSDNWKSHSDQSDWLLRGMGSY